MSANEVSSAVCPYYKEEIGRQISCEGIWTDSTLHFQFRSAEQKKAYRRQYCYCKHWRSCPYAAALNVKYDF